MCKVGQRHWKTCIWVSNPVSITVYSKCTDVSICCSNGMATLLWASLCSSVWFQITTLSILKNHKSQTQRDEETNPSVTREVHQRVKNDKVLEIQDDNAPKVFTKTNHSLLWMTVPQMDNYPSKMEWWLMWQSQWNRSSPMLRLL